jgi:hypothetical protein
MFGQSRPPPGDPRSHGAGRDLEDLPDLRVVEPEDVAQHHRRAELDRESRQGGVDGVPIGNRGLERGRSRAGVRGEVLGREGTTLAPAQLVEARVRRHPVGPGREGGATVEAIQTPNDGDQRFLGGVGRVGVVPGQPAAQGVDAVVVSPEQDVEGSAVAGASGDDERPVVVLGNDGGSLVNGPRGAGARHTASSTWAISTRRGESSGRPVIHRSTALPCSPRKSNSALPAMSLWSATAAPQPASVLAGSGATKT